MRTLILLTISISLLLFCFWDGFGIIYKNNYPIEILVYKNIKVEINNNYVKGDLSDGHNISSLNNDCYILNCGFPSTGSFSLSKITFVKIEDRPRFVLRTQYYLMESCINDNKQCFYNLPKDFVTQQKKELLYKAKDNIKWSIIIIIGILIGGFIDDITARKRLQQIGIK